MRGEVFDDGEGGDGRDAFFAHDHHGGGGEEVGVVDGGDAGLRGERRAGLAGAVDADAGAGAVGLGDGGGEFGFGVLEGRRPLVIDKAVAAGLVDFGKVGAAFALFAHDVDDLVGGVGVIRIGEDVLGGVVPDGVFVPASDVDRVARNPHPGAGDFAAVDGVANGDVGAARAFGAHVALGGETGENVGFGGCRGGEDALRDGLLHGLEVFGAGVQKQVDVGVDETGHEGGVAEVDDLRAGWVRDVRADFADAVAFDEDFSGSNNLAGGDVEGARGVEDGDLLRRTAFLRGGGRNQGEREEDAGRESHVSQ